MKAVSWRLPGSLALLLAPVAVMAEPGSAAAGLIDLAPRELGNLAAATYSAIFATALVSLALTFAVREAAYRDFTAFAALWGGFLALAHGHAYLVPGLGPLLGALGPGLLLWVGALVAAAAVAAASGLLGLASLAPALDRLARGLGLGMIVLGALLALIPAGRLPSVVSAWAALLLGVLLLPALAAAWSAHRGSRAALAQALLWLLFWSAAGAQLTVTAGWMAGGDGLLWLQQPGGLLAVLGLSIALTDRVIALRQQAESLQVLHASSSAVLRVEQKRREFAAALEAATAHSVEPSDMEWRTFRLLLQVLPETLPLRAAALTVTGYRGFDYLLAQPLTEKPRICGLLTERASTFRSLCRSRMAMVLPADPSEPQAPRLAVVPLPVGKPGWGVLLLERAGGADFASEELELASELAQQAFRLIEQGVRAVDLRRRADADPLTGMLNPRAGSEQLARRFEEARRSAAPLALVFIDLDLFRLINERAGTATGDRCLREIDALLQPSLREQDLRFRHGGDEFVLVLPGAAIEFAEVLAERVRAAVAAHRFDAGQQVIKLTASFGVAGLQAGDDTPQRLLDRAARAAEMAKGQGRNRVARAKGFGAAGEAPEAPPIF